MTARIGAATRDSQDRRPDDDRIGLGPPFHPFHRAVMQLLAHRPDIDGRILVAAALAVYFLIVAVPRAVWSVDLWPRLGVPSAPSLFFDTRNVTSALECRRLGYDPLRENPCDPRGRPMNYPRVFLALRWLGLNQSHTDALALAIIALFLGCMFLLLGRLTLGQGIVVAVAACSPSVMFAIHRANMDLLVFSLVALAVVAWRSRRPAGRITSPLAILAAATAKIYPPFGLLVYAFTRKRAATITAGVSLAVFGAYALVTLDDIEAVARTAPQGEFHSFGARILIARLYHTLIPDRWQAGAVSKQLLAMIPLLAGALVLWLWARRRFARSNESTDSGNLLAFFFGSFIYLGTFAIGNNFDYRLVFLLLTLPQLFEWTADRADRRSGLSATTVVVVLVLLWIGAVSEPLRAADEVVSWAAAGLLVPLLAASIPPVADMWRGLAVRRQGSDVR